MMGGFGCSRETMDRIAKALGMSAEELARTGLDLDVLDTARGCFNQGVDVEDIKSLEWWPPGFIDAVAIAAREAFAVESAAPKSFTRRFPRCDT